MSSSPDERDPLEILFSEFLELRRNGEKIDIETFASRHPEQADNILSLFPILETLEQARSSPEQQNNIPFAPKENISGGLNLGEYHLLREIGAGGMGIVYEAMQESMQRRVAVKVLPQEFSQQEVRRNRFLQEARTVARLSYRNIVPIYDFGESDNRYFFAMGLIEGAGLDWVILRLGEEATSLTSTELLQHFQELGIPLSEQQKVDQKLVDAEESLSYEFKYSTSSNASTNEKHRWVLKNDSWKQFARIGLQAARALKHAHQAGILHRDIKPGNLLLDEEGVIWITDFGLAKTENELSLTAPDDVVGTLRYLSPERFHGQIDARSDIYALGLTLIELCTQRPAFSQSGRSELIRNIMDGNMTPPREIAPSIPAAFENILLKATAQNPARRYQSAEEMAEDLRAFSRGAQVAPQVPLLERPFVTRLKKNWLNAVLAIICLVQTAVLLVSSGALRKNNPVSPDQMELAKNEVQVRLQAVDALYERLTERDITSDLPHSLTIKPLPPGSLEREDLQNLLPLYQQLSLNAQWHHLPKIEKEANQRVKLLTRILK